MSAPPEAIALWHLTAHIDDLAIPGHLEEDSANSELFKLLDGRCGSLRLSRWGPSMRVVLPVTHSPRLSVLEGFASPALAERLLRCVALDPTEWSEYSDHSPIVATTVGERTARVVRNPLTRGCAGRFKTVRQAPPRVFVVSFHGGRGQETYREGRPGLELGRPLIDR
jgi:hypothetical protein